MAYRTINQPKDSIIDSMIVSAIWSCQSFSFIACATCGIKFYCFSTEEKLSIKKTKRKKKNGPVSTFKKR